MKYRLGKKVKKEERLKEFLKMRLYVFAHLADELNITAQGLHDILDGRSRKPRRQTLERLAEITKTRLGFDSSGVYFEPMENEIVNGEEKFLKISEPLFDYKKASQEEEINPGEYLTKINKLLITLEESGDRETLRIIYKFIHDIGEALAARRASP